MQNSKTSRDQSGIIQSDIKRQFTKFLQTFPDESNPKYFNSLRKLIEAGKHILIIGYQDLVSFNNELANFIFDQYYKHEHLLNQTITQLAQQFIKNDSQLAQGIKKDEFQKQEVFQIAFDAGIHGTEEISVRDLKCQRLGRLFSFKGTVTRTSQVRPQLVQGVFKCKSCGAYSKPIPQQFKYTEPKKCFTMNCDKPVWQLDLRHLKTIIKDFQKLRVQEDPTKIPPGAMPRSIDVILRNENTQKGQPGDICRFIGYLCVLPEVASMIKPGQKTTISTRNNQTRGQMMDMQGVRGIKGIRQLNYRLIFVATNVIVENNQFRQEQADDEQEMNINENRQEMKPQYNQDLIFRKVFSRLTENQIRQIKQFKSNPNLYQDLADSLFPSIFGQSEIKKAILLQLFGGIHKVTKNKISIRGDINILIVGDPSTAKSQFLKAVNKFVPRSVYTNGKTTSAAGLTATVTKDQSGTVGIQAGALMLADNGICCIDEFDKMKYTDQTAIHEAMEQQTISIAKAGVYATLNARTSILAAANPVFGRYDKSKSLKNNLNISAPIMSRFDLFFVVCDETNDSADANLSQFIINMHRNKERAIVTKYDTKSIKLYISTAKKLKPMITRQAAELLRKFYKQLRSRDKSSQNTSYKVTVRQLQSMIRISEALAKMNLDCEIKGDYVRQAYRLITTCIMKLQKSPIMLNQDEEDPENVFDKNSLIRGDIALQRQLQQKKKQKSHKLVTISFQQYQQILKYVLQLFQMKKQMRNQSQIEQQIQINQQVIINFILAKKVESGLISTETEAGQMKKLINAIIKKLIKQQRVLMIVEDNMDLSKKVLKIHPNFVAN